MSDKTVVDKLVYYRFKDGKTVDIFFGNKETGEIHVGTCLVGEAAVVVANVRTQFLNIYLPNLKKFLADTDDYGDNFS